MGAAQALPLEDDASLPETYRRPETLSQLSWTGSHLTSSPSAT
jgi:hypothetical protein